MGSLTNVAIDRINQLLDEGSFVELYGSVVCRKTELNQDPSMEPSDGVVTGYGLINGQLVFVYSQNPDVLNGSFGEMHCKKIVQTYAQAIKVGAPVIGILDSTGMRLMEGTDALSGLGEVISAISEASGIIPMYSIVYGNCGGGLSLIPAMSDFTYVVAKTGKLYVNSPNTLDGNAKEKLDTSAGEYVESNSGVVDTCATYEEICAQIKELMRLLPGNNTEGTITARCQDDLNRTLEGFGSSNYEARVLLSNLADDYVFVETSKQFGKDVITGFMQLNGITIGVFSNDETAGRITVSGLQKATDFVRFCDAYEIPLLTIMDVVGFDTTVEMDKSMGRAMAGFVSAITEADVPKVSLVPRKAFGTAYLIMNSKSLGADFAYAWPEADMGILPADQAVKVVYDLANTNLSKEEFTAEYAMSHNGADAFARRGMIDRIITPESTRKYLISAFDLLYTKYSCVQDKKHSLR